MSKKRKSTKKDSGNSQDIKISDKNKMTFKAWFSRSVIMGLVKSWQESEIKAFFKDSSLNEKESQEIFDETLKKY
jgi:hypothetical protein